MGFRVLGSRDFRFRDSGLLGKVLRDFRFRGSGLKNRAFKFMAWRGELMTGCILGCCLVAVFRLHPGILIASTGKKGC